jgi:hypothetical protein
MTANDIQRDPVLAAVRELRTYDVSPERAQRLRAQCHRKFDNRETTRRLSRTPTPTVWTRVAGALAGAWSVVYFLETIRRAAAVCGF